MTYNISWLEGVECKAYVGIIALFQDSEFKKTGNVITCKAKNGVVADSLFISDEDRELASKCATAHGCSNENDPRVILIEPKVALEFMVYWGYNTKSPDGFSKVDKDKVGNFVLVSRINESWVYSSHNSDSNKTILQHHLGYI